MVPFRYNVRSLLSRRVSSLLAVIGIGVVVGVATAMMALKEGVDAAMVLSGSPENMLVLRESAQSEATSFIGRDAYNVVRALPGIVQESDRRPLVTPELVVVVKVARSVGDGESNLSVRGVTRMSFRLRPYVSVVEGRSIRFGTNEILVSRRIADRYPNCRVGDSIRLGRNEFIVVGTFSAHDTAIESEIWADLEYLALVHRRDAYSSVLLRPTDGAAFDALQASMKADPRLHLQTTTEREYYARQTAGTVGVRIMVAIVTLFSTFGAMLGVMNITFSSAAARKRDFATLRALGFSRRAVTLCVLGDSIMVSVLGGMLGLLFVLPLDGFATGTVNFVTFSELAFSFSVSGTVALSVLSVAICAGVVGGVLPAIVTARVPIASALREV